MNLCLPAIMRFSPTTYKIHKIQVILLAVNIARLQFGTSPCSTFSEVLHADVHGLDGQFYGTAVLRYGTFLSASLYFSTVKEALIEIGCVVTSLVVGWLSRACTVAKRCILGL